MKRLTISILLIVLANAFLLAQNPNAARFRGILTSEEADQLQEYVKKSREEWDRDI